jgi:hypothetical protein
MVSFLATGGTAPYSYTLRPHGAGGTIDNATGVYTSPSEVPSDPEKMFDTIEVRDSSVPALVATAKVMVGYPLHLLCDILQHELNLPLGRVYLFDQKIFQPTDTGIYIAVSVGPSKPYGNTVQFDGSGAGLDAVQSVNMMSQIDIDVISRSAEALIRKEEVLMALASVYSQQQQQANSFYIGNLPPGSHFMNLSSIDGAAIPYRFKISVQMQYLVKKKAPINYFDTFQDVAVKTNP